jgi:signal transduction histidine kinase
LLTPVLETARKLPLPRLAKQTYLALAREYEALGQTQAALTAMKAHQALQDSLEEEKQSSQFSEAESSFDLQERQEHEFAALTAKQEMVKRFYLLGAIAVLIIGLFLSIWLGNRLQKERKKRLGLNQQFHTLWQEKNLLSSQHSRLSQLASLASASLHAPLKKVQQALTSPAASSSDSSSVQAFEQIENWVVDLALYASVGQVEGEKRPLNLADTVREAIGQLPESLSKQMPRIIMKDLPTILGHPEQMTLLFRQLLANAIEYRGAEAPHIEISAQHQGEGYEISLQDNGRGMPVHLIQTLFDVGYRVETASISSSAGIGLAICKAIVELHEGRIWAENGPNGGTTILFSLPSSPRI